MSEHGAAVGRTADAAGAADHTASGTVPSDAELVRRAIAARERAYVPYSHFAVGAALLAADGTVFEGCNIENAAYTPSNCAERTAFFKAVSEGQRDFAAIAVVGGPEGAHVSTWCAPCGVCRQVMREFCDPASFRVLLARSAEERKSYLLQDLLPESFGPSDLDHRDPAATADTTADTAHDA